VVEKVLQMWREYETQHKWQLVDCKQNVQAFADLAVDLGQSALVSAAMQQEFRRQRIKPE
jgi:hypothetical protein